MTKDILGTGLKFPLELDAKGAAVLVSNSQLIQQSLVEILTTQLGTRPFLPQFGSRIHLLRYEQNAAILRSLMNTYIFEALQQEPRVQFKNLEIEQQGITVIATISYTIVATTKTESLVIPFFNDIPY